MKWERNSPEKQTRPATPYFKLSDMERKQRYTERVLHELSDVYGTEFPKLADDDLKKIVDAAAIDIDANSNIGADYERLKTRPREMAFAKLWFEWNEPKVGFNHGCGTLQDLFIENMQIGTKVTETITLRDRMIVATVIQWLGSNVGMEFLRGALERCGYEIIEK